MRSFRVFGKGLGIHSILQTSPCLVNGFPLLTGFLLYDTVSNNYYENISYRASG